MNKNIALIYGDCSSPEIVTQAVRVLDKIAAKHGHTFSYTRAYMGGEALSLIHISEPTRLRRNS